MEKILSVDLTKKEVTLNDYDLEKWGHYGRGLAVDLIKNNVPKNAARYSPENAVVFVPGLFTGCKVSSACRLMIATKKDRSLGIQLSNVTGNFPQKMASLSIAGLVVAGQATEKNSILHIKEDGVEILSIKEIENKNTSAMMRILKKEFGCDAGIIAVGKCADMQMSLSTFICTYPNGEPEYHCPRSGFGDVFGSKNLRAVVITGEKYFNRKCKDEESFVKAGKSLAKIIIDNDICGDALPGHGSVALIRILKNREEENSKKRNMPLKNQIKEQKNKDELTKEKSKKINYCCAPMCVIGCLNRHSIVDGQAYSSPDESEVREALKSCYGIDDYEYTKEIRSRSYEIGIVGTEFVTATKVYFEATNLPWGKKEILNLLDEVEKGSIIGRIVASRTLGISKLYSENKSLLSLLDREAVEDENSFKISLNSTYNNLENLSNIEILYAQIFVLENLGFCIFSSFATVNSNDALNIMAKLFTYKTGINVASKNLLEYAIECMKSELEYEKENAINDIKRNIPPFTKVLYRYFSK